MSVESQRVSENAFGSLRSCLVEGDPLSEKRARRIKQRAVAISIALQSLALAILILFPLLSKGERISLKNMTPIPPYAPIGDRRPSASPRPHGPNTPPPCHICPPTTVPRIVVTHVDSNPVSPGDSPGDPIPGLLPGPGTPGGLLPTDTHPTPPQTGVTPPATQRHRISELQQMAQLVHRVEPIYPPLARQIRHEGRVELHAIISPEGAIESLQVISGDPLLIQSALDAVREWRYRPTILNGQAIEVDTQITVIYTLSH
jgi:protein TonB